MHTNHKDLDEFAYHSLVSFQGCRGIRVFIMNKNGAYGKDGRRV